MREYRVCYCDECGKETEYGLSVESKCDCGGDNWKATHFKNENYNGIRLERKIIEILKGE